MDKEKLQQYRHLCREIEELEDEKQALAEGRLGSSWPRGGRRRTGSVGDPVGEDAAALWQLSQLLAARLNELVALRCEIEQFIEALPPEERRILRLYYINGLSWENVAEAVGYSARHLNRKQRQIMQRLFPATV